MGNELFHPFVYALAFDDIRPFSDVPGAALMSEGSEVVLMIRVRSGCPTLG